MKTHHSFFGRDELSVSMHYAEGELYIEEKKATNEISVCISETFYKLKKNLQPTADHEHLHLFITLSHPSPPKVHVNLVMVLPNGNLKWTPI